MPGQKLTNQSLNERHITITYILQKESELVFNSGRAVHWQIHLITMYVGSIEITGGTKGPALGTSVVDDFLLIEFNLISIPIPKLCLKFVLLGITFQKCLRLFFLVILRGNLTLTFYLLQIT